MESMLEGRRMRVLRNPDAHPRIAMADVMADHSSVSMSSEGGGVLLRFLSRFRVSRADAIPACSPQRSQCRSHVRPHQDLMDQSVRDGCRLTQSHSDIAARSSFSAMKTPTRVFHHRAHQPRASLQEHGLHRPTASRLRVLPEACIYSVRVRVRVRVPLSQGSVTCR